MKKVCSINSFLMRALILWTGVSAVLLVVYLLAFDWIWQGWYYVTWPTCAGGLLWHHRDRLKKALTQWRLPVIIKYILLVYGMVLIEEILAGTLNHLSEGFDISIYFTRIGQFWLLNLLAFSGMGWGSYLVFSRVKFSLIEMFFIFGLFGQYAEGLIFKLFDPEQVISALVLMPLNLWVYGVIFLPAILLIEGNAQKHMRAIFRYPLVFVVILLASIPFIVTLDQSREAYPELYPPRHMIP